MNFYKWIVVCIGLLILLLILSWTSMLMSALPRGVTYNCELAEISPDYPTKVKDRCRELRSS